jgi:hypothetical protein
MLKKIPGGLVLFLTVAGLLSTAPAQQPPVLVVHDEAEPMQKLAEGLSDWHGIAAELVDQQDFKAIGERQAVFMYVHKPLLDHVETALIDYAEYGGRLIVLHHGIASAKIQNPRWLKFLGIQIQPRDDPQHPWKVLRGTYELVNLAPKHFVTGNKVSYPARVHYTPSDAPAAQQSLPALELPHTEIFLNHIFVDGREKIVLFGFRTEVDGEVYMQDRAGWLKRTRAGTTFYFQPGHYAKDYTRDYVQILANAMLWDGE